MNYSPSRSHFLYGVHLLFAEVESETAGGGGGHVKGRHSFSLSLVLAHAFLFGRTFRCWQDVRIQTSKSLRLAGVTSCS